MLDVERWPELDYAKWKETYETLHRWTQIAGKIRLSKSPWTNHGWHSTLYLSETGLTTSVVYDGARSFSLEFDFVYHVLRIRVSNGQYAILGLISDTVSSFHARVKTALRELGIEVSISEKPNELADAIPFSEDLAHKTYVPEQANRCWRVMSQSDRVMKQFRSRFVGKASPVHFFWGSFDLAASRFSGRRAPEHPGGFPHLPDLIAREAYSHEVFSCGFWPGNEAYPRAAFYSYAYPQPRAFEQTKMPDGAVWDDKFREFLLPYDLLRKSSSPDELLLDFFQTAYNSAADLGRWDREALENSPYLQRLQSQNRAA